MAQKKFKTLAELKDRIDDYFANGGRAIPRTSEIYYTCSGLCIWLGISRDTFSNMSRLPGYADTIKCARERIENNCEELASLGLINVTFAIFSLKNNFGWADRPAITEDDTTLNRMADDLERLVKRTTMAVSNATLN